MSKLQAYKRHLVSYQLEANHPYLDDIRSHLAHDEVSTAFGSRLLPRLEELLTSKKVNPPELVEALETATALMSNQEYKCSAVSAGLCQAVSDLMLHQDTPVQRAAVLTLSRMALVLLGREGLAATGAADRLADLLLSAEDEQVKANVAEAMACFAIAQDGAQYLVDRGCVHAIGSHLLGVLPNPDSPTAAECAVGLLTTLRHVATTAHLGVRDLLGQGVLEKIVAFVSKTSERGVILTLGHAKTPETVEHALAVLGAVASEPTGRKELISANAVEALVPYLATAWPVNVREKAISALLALSIEVEGKQRLVTREGKAGSVKAVVTFLQNPEESKTGLDVCRRLCLSAGELPAFRLEFVQEMVLANGGDQLQSIFGVTVCAPLAQLLEKTKKLTVRHATLDLFTAVLGAFPTTSGDKIFVPPMKPGHKMDPVSYTLETCPAIVERLLALMLQRPGVLPADQLRPLKALQLLAGHEMGKAEVARLLDARGWRSQLAPDILGAVEDALK